MAYNIAKRNPIYDIIKGFLIILGSSDKCIGLIV